MNPKDNKAKNKPKRPFLRYLLYDFLKLTAIIPALISLRPKKIYVSPKAKKVRGGAVLIANHVSFFDPVVMMTVFFTRRLFFLTLRSIYEHRSGFFKICCLPVDKENFSYDTFRDSCDILSAGQTLVIFPEGGINDISPETVNTFKSGAVLMAFKSGTPIVPVYIPKRGPWYTRTYAVIGEPVDVKAICGERPSVKTFEEISTLLREKELELMEIYNTRRGK